MKSALVAFLASVVIFLIFPLSVLASGFYLKTIGALDVEGGMYSQIWYTSPGNITFTGISPPGAVISATVDGANGSATADGSGNWSYTTNLSEGDHQITFSTEVALPLTFTLTLGAVPDGIGAIPKADTPQAGIGAPTIILLAFGGMLISSSVYTFK